MEYEIEFRLIDIKDINKIQRTEKVEDSLFGEKEMVDCKYDITDEYCKQIMKKLEPALDTQCEVKYIGCTDRIGHYEFEVNIKDKISYTVIFQQDTYEWNIQLTVYIGYRNLTDKVKFENKYDLYLEKIKIFIKNNLVKDWYKCVWISDAQSLELSKEVYSEIYVAENELRAFISKVMIENLGAEWYDRPEFYKMRASIELNGNNVKRNVPSFANIDINLYTITLEDLMKTVKVDIYSDLLPSDLDIQKEIKRCIFSTTQLDKMQAALSYLKNRYTKKYNIWDKFFLPLIDEPVSFQKLLSDFIANRNHVAHNKLLDAMAKDKMLNDTRSFRESLSNAVKNFNKNNISMEVEETLQAIEDQREYEREAHLEIIESEAGVRIRNSKEILEMFCEVVDNLFTDIYNKLYFSEIMEVHEQNKLLDKDNEQTLFTITQEKNTVLTVYGLVKINDSEGTTSQLKVTVIGINDEIVSEEFIEYINGEAEYNSEHTNYLPVVQDFLDAGNVKNIKKTVEKYLCRLIDNYETNGYSEKIRAADDWKADAAEMLEE